MRDETGNGGKEGRRGGLGASGLGRIVPLGRFLEARRFRAQGLVLSYWEALRGARPMPSRAEVDPRGIEDALEYAFILERIAPRHGRIRIAGRHLCDLAGCEVRGMPFSVLFEAESREAVGDVIEAVLSRPAIAEMELRAGGGFGRGTLDGRLLLLPLTSEEGEVTRVLGCLETDGRLGRAPRRLTITGHRLRPVPGSGEAAATEAEPLPEGFAEPAAPYEAPQRARGVPHLRLVKSDREG